MQSPYVRYQGMSRPSSDATVVRCDLQRTFSKSVSHSEVSKVFAGRPNQIEVAQVRP